MSDNSQALVKAGQTAPVQQALTHPLNLALLGGAVAVVAILHLWWVAAIAGVGEILWLMVASRSMAVRRGFARTRRLDRQRALYDTLDEAAQRRAQRLRELQRRIEAAAERSAATNDGFRVEVLRPEIDKLEELIDGFLELASAVVRYDGLLRPQALASLQADIARYEAQVAELPAGDGRREAAQQNLALLYQRRDRLAELKGRRQTTVAEMDLVENTLRLLGDEVLGMRSATELGERLGELQRGVEVARQTARETEGLFRAQQASGAAR